MPQIAPEQQIIDQLLAAWNSQNRQLTEWLNKLPAQSWLQEVAPGKNSGIYLLGHLIAVSDALLPLLGFGERLYPELEKPFLSNPYKPGSDYPGLEQLITCWTTVNQRLDASFNTCSPANWLSRHQAVSEADFALQPHRNKLNVLISRMNHLAYHIGQLRLLPASA